MAKIFRYLLILLNLHHIYSASVTETEDLQKKFTSKCDDLCISRNENGTIEDLGNTECLRGCQYFNIEFLLNARNKDKTVDLNELVERCGSSCSEAYEGDKLKKEICFSGCNEMMKIQAKAPILDNYLVYMGATDRNMVLLQSDFDIPSKEDWVLLDSIFRANDYDYDAQFGTNNDKILKADSRGQIDSVSRFEDRDRFTINYCIPSWMWILPLLMLVAFIWMHYSNYVYSAFFHEGLQLEFDIADANHFNNTIPMSHQTAMSDGNKKILRPNNEYIVGSDYFFYPAPVISPPKYNEVAEAILMGGSDGDDDDDDENDGDKSKKNGTRLASSMERTSLEGALLIRLQ